MSSRHSRLIIVLFSIISLIFLAKLTGIANFLSREKIPEYDIQNDAPIKRVYFATTLFGQTEWRNEIFRNWSYDKPVKCPSNYQCELTYNSHRAHALLFHGRELSSVASRLHQTRRANQRWIFFSWESNKNADVVLSDFWKRKFNWTATYMPNSDIVAPFSRGFFPLRASEKRAVSGRPLYNVSEKSGFSFIVMSNCRSNSRNNYLKELKRFMKIDVYGKCGKPVARGKEAIINLSRRYRYYLAFENSVCRDYMTEKFWYNGLYGYAVPIVNGGFSRDDYANIAPPNSFIYAPDFKSPRDMANFLQNLSNDEGKYAAYFEWKRSYRVDKTEMDEILFCNLCHRLHTDLKPSISDINSFWNATANCRDPIPKSNLFPFVAVFLILCILCLLALYFKNIRSLLK